ncbi:MAG: LamG-like jellyroll fold domain-containing protein [Phycisphaeraceae bacterium]
MPDGPEKLNMDELATLIMCYLEDHASPEQVARLEVLLDRDPAAREMLISLSTLQATLQEKYRLDGSQMLLDEETSEAVWTHLIREEHQASPLPTQVGDDRSYSNIVQRKNRSGGQELGEAEASEAGPNAMVFQIGGMQVYRHAGERRSGGFRWRRFAVAAAVLLAALFYLMPPTQPERTTAPTRPPVVATLTQQNQAVWADSDQFKRDGATLHTGAVRLASGFAEITMARGATILLQGPCEVVLKDDNAVSLDRGRLSALVPEEARLFTVKTPTVDVVDFGTAFGVEVDREGSTQAAVFDGLVELQQTNADAGDSQRTVRLALHSGTTARVGIDRVIPTAAEALADHDLFFVRQMPLTQREVDILASAPSVFVPFARRRGDQMWTLFSTRPVETIARGAVGAAAAPHIGGEVEALWLDGTDGTIALEGSQRLVWDNGVTIAAWVNIPADTGRLMRIISNCDGDRGFGLAVNDSARLGNDKSNMLMFTFFGILDVHCDQSVPSDRWVHVAAVATPGMQVQFYIDGEPVSGTNVGEATAQQATLRTPMPLTVGRNPADLAAPEDYWEGGIQELVLFTKALSNDQVASLYDSAEAFGGELDP